MLSGSLRTVIWCLFFLKCKQKMAIRRLRLTEYIASHIVYCSVIENYDATARSGFDVYTAVFAKLVVAAAEVVAHGLYGDIEAVGDAVHATVGQTVFEAAEIVEGDGFCHDTDSI